jgi:hypothetical protein
MIPPVSAIQNGLTTVRRAMERLDAAAQVVSTAYLPMDDGRVPGSADVVGSLVEMMLAKHQVEVGAKVIERASDAEKSLLDILA